MMCFSVYFAGSDFMFYMFLADGFEETEALVTLDMLRRAAIDVRTVGVGSEIVCGTHGIKVFSDIGEGEVSTDFCDGVILPGGMPGTENLFASETVNKITDYCFGAGKLICAICAAPVIPGRKGLLKGHKAVCFPGFENELAGATVCDVPCVKSDNIITAKGAGCVFEFSYEIISAVKGQEKAEEIISTIQHKGL